MPSQYTRLWIALAVVVAASFAVLGFFGYRGIQNAPPIPREVATTEGRVLFDRDTIQTGQGPRADGLALLASHRASR